MDKTNDNILEEISRIFFISEDAWHFFEQITALFAMPIVLMNRKNQPLAFSKEVQDYSPAMPAKIIRPDRFTEQLSYLKILSEYDAVLSPALGLFANYINKMLITDRELAESSNAYISAITDILEGRGEKRHQLYFRLESSNVEYDLRPPRNRLISIKVLEIETDIEAVKQKVQVVFMNETVFVYNTMILVLITHPKVAVIETEQRNELTEILTEYNMIGCISDEFEDIFKLKTYFYRNIGLLTSTKMVPDLIPLRFLDYDKYKFDCMVFLANSTEPELPNTQFVSEVVMKIKEYDEKNETELLYTLYSFIINDASYVKTAKVMYLHRNTITYRIERIKELFDIKIDTVEERFNLYFSYRILRLLGEI